MRIDVNQPVTARLAWVVERYAERVAAKSPTHQLTYAELDAATNQVAQTLLRRLGGRAEPVASLLGPDVWPLVANHGILKARKFYVELDAGHPPERSRFILNDSGARGVITDTEHLALAQELATPSQQLLNLDDILSGPPAADPRLSLSADTIACLIYTSGSTGRPKGVITTHRGMMIRVRDAAAFRDGPEERVLSVGARAAYIGAPLIGAASIFFDVKRAGFQALGKWMGRERVTCFQGQTTAFRNLIQALPPGTTLPDVRLVFIGGEPLRAADILAARPVFAPDCEFITGYSMTETGSISLYDIHPEQHEPDDILPGGYIVPSKEVLVLGPDGQPLPAGEYGDLVVRGDTLALGYWNLPKETRARFLPDPEGAGAPGARRLFLTGDRGRLRADGCLELLGRSDFMVKIRGARVELEEVENALRRLDGVQQAAAAARAIPGEQPGELRLVAYIVPTAGTTLTVSKLRHELQRRLPAPAIPTSFIFLERLPTTPSGKIDHVALPEPGNERPQLDTPYVAPRTPLESWLADLWAEVLRLERVGVEDSFLDLGGHSLLATQIAARVTARFGERIVAGDLLQAPTVARMALIVLRHLAEELEPSQLDDALAAQSDPTHR